MVFYPVVGLGIGLALAMAGRLLAGGSPSVAAAVLVGLWALITGFLHLDGLADTADAWLGGHGDRERTLEILDDSRVGTAGATALGVILLVKFAALTELLAGARWMALAAAPLLGRAGGVALLLATPYVRSGGLGEAPTRHVPAAWAWTAVAASVLLALVMAGDGGLASLVVAGGALTLLRWLTIQRLGGMVGDCLGAGVEISEALVLVALASS